MMEDKSEKMRAILGQMKTLNQRMKSDQPYGTRLNDALELERLTEEYRSLLMKL